MIVSKSPRHEETIRYKIIELQTQFLQLIYKYYFNSMFFNSLCLCTPPPAGTTLRGNKIFQDIIIENSFCRYIFTTKRDIDQHGTKFVIKWWKVGGSGKRRERVKG